MICDSCCENKNKNKQQEPQTAIDRGGTVYVINNEAVWKVGKTSIRNPNKEQGVFAIYNQNNKDDAKERMEKFNISKYYIKSEDEAKEPVTTPNKNKLWAKSGRLNDKHFNIDKNKPHLTAAFSVHGDKEFRKFCKAEDPGPAEGLIDDFFNLFKPGDIESKKSFYFKTSACHGAYHDGTKTIFDKIQEILKNCKGEPPKCFVKIGKKDFPLRISYGTTDGENIDKKVILPNEEEPEKKETDSEYSVRYNKDATMRYACCTNPAEKDKCFDYYYVTKNAIYKVPHALVHNRVKLIDEGKFDKEFEKYLRLKNIDINEDPDDEKYKKKISEMSGLARKCVDEQDFSEWYNLKNNLYDSPKVIEEKNMLAEQRFRQYKEMERKYMSLQTIPQSWRNYY